MHVLNKLFYFHVWTIQGCICTVLCRIFDELNYTVNLAMSMIVGVLIQQSAIRPHGYKKNHAQLS